MPETPTIGLLVCDHLDPVVRDAIGGDYQDLLFPDLLGPVGAELRLYEAVNGDLPADPFECDAWVTTGSRHSAMDEDPWIQRLGEFLGRIVESGRPLVAICFGHQLLAKAQGGRVVRSENGWGVGPKRFEVTGSPAWLAGQDDGFEVLMSHRDQVEVAPAGAEVFASADYCPIGGYTIGDSVISLQGHPEFVGELSEVLINRRREAIGDDVCDEALGRLHAEWSDSKIRSGVVTFLRDRLGYDMTTEPSGVSSR